MLNTDSSSQPKHRKLVPQRPKDFLAFDNSSIFQGIHQRFEEQVRLHPDQIALKSHVQTATYAQLNDWANCLALEILRVAGTKLSQAGLLMANTNDTIVAMLGSLKAHKAYVPLDANFPKERLQIMLEDAQPSVILTDTAHFALAHEMVQSTIPVIDVQQIKRFAGTPNPNVACDPMDRAYILYTSGSTGRPKGIEFLHRNLLHTTMCLINQLYFSGSDRVTWLHSPSFGSSVVDIYCCLTNGGTLYPWDVKTQGFNGMAQWLLDQRVTTFQWIPSAFRQFLKTVPEGTVFKDIRIVIMAGEPLTIKEVELFRRFFPRGSHLVNQVGTGESYNYYLYLVDHDLEIEGASVPGGYPVSDERKVLILDDEKKEVPQGTIGEIGIKSNYMSAGYWCAPELTREKFVSLGGDPTPVYLTGDLGKIEPDGCLMHLGRKDFQVKVRGCRIEVAEVEHVLGTVPGVQDSAVWIAKNQTDEDQLIGYIVVKDGTQFDEAEAIRILSAKLPSYMVPKHYVILDALPSLPTGKVNRRGLPNPFDRSRQRVLEKAPISVVEEQIVEIFKDLLRIDDIDSHSNFTQLGGDSLLAAVLYERLQRKFKVEIMLNQINVELTPARLAQMVQSATSKHKSAQVAEKAQSGSRTVQSQSKARTFIKGAGKRNLIIVGAGMQGREIFTWAEQTIAAGTQWKIKGFLDRKLDALDNYDYPCKVLCDVDDYQIENDDIFIGAIGDPKNKKKCCSLLASRGAEFVNIIHPRANLGRNVQLGVGIVLAPFSSVTSDLIIGNHVSVGAFSNLAHDTITEDFCQISSHCGLNGQAQLGEGAFLGSHSCVVPAIRVGAWAYVCAGSIVTKNVPDGVKVFGNPAVATRS